MARTPEFTIYEDLAGEWRWTLRAANGLKIADSGEGYKTEANVKRALRRVIETIERGNAPVYNATTKRRVLLG